jgi:hypothetical protein
MIIGFTKQDNSQWCAGEYGEKTGLEKEGIREWDNENKGSSLDKVDLVN